MRATQYFALMLPNLKPDHRDLLFPNVGPLLMRYRRGAEYLESCCHRCGWSTFGYFHDCYHLTSWHLWDSHNPDPKPKSNNVMRAPGRW